MGENPQELKFAVLSRPRTQALVEGRLNPGGLPIQWVPSANPLGLGEISWEKEHGLLPGGFAGGEMSVSSFVRFKSSGAPLLALPIFLKRGHCLRSLLCSSETTLRSPRQLEEKRIASVNHNSSMPTWIRGTLLDSYQLSRSGPRWMALSSPSPQSQVKVRAIPFPEQFVASEIQSWEELDGYPHSLDRRECFLLSLLERGELDAVLSYQVRIGSGRFKPLLTEDELWAHYQRSEIYPINHIFVIHQDLVHRVPNIGMVLLQALREARKLWLDYLPEENRKPMEKEMERLGWDPFSYFLGDVEKKTLTTFTKYLVRDGLIPEPIPVEDFFLKDALQG